MDILFWTKLNPKISSVSVNKRFFNQYCYKLELSIPGSSFLRNMEIPLLEQAEQRKNIRKHVNYAGSWRLNYLNVPSEGDLELLECVKQHKPKFDSLLKFRIEEPNIQVYAESEQDLYDFATAISTAGVTNTHLSKIHRPLSDQHLIALQQGYTVKNRATDYAFKVNVREGRYSKDRKQHILNYLISLEDQVHLPLHFIDSMEKKYDSVWNCYFYIKDRGILTMLAIIDPTFVRMVEEFQVISK